MADGVDARAFAQRLKDANPSERRQLISRYKAWIWDGARAQGAYRYGLVPIGASLFLALVLSKYPGELWLWLVWAALLVVGILLTAKAFRRERDWRRANPFRYEDSDA